MGVPLTMSCFPAGDRRSTASEGATELRVRLPAHDVAPAAARHSLGSVTPALGPSAAENLELLVSELVTNSIRHARLGPEEWVELTVTSSPETLRAEVADPGPGFDPPAHPTPRPGHEGGMGLFFLDRLADRWGVRREDDANCVWFEIDRPGAKRR